jgi:hypothetical protein
VAMLRRARARVMRTRGVRKRGSYREFQEVDATSVAKFPETRCTDASGIPRRSPSGGWQDPDVDRREVLEKKEGANNVRGVR